MRPQQCALTSCGLLHLPQSITLDFSTLHTPLSVNIPTHKRRARLPTYRRAYSISTMRKGLARWRSMIFALIATVVPYRSTCPPLRARGRQRRA